MSIMGRILCSLEKFFVTPSLAQLVNASTSVQFSGENNYNISSTISRLQTPLRI
jgi:hypothetical protein